MDPASRPLGISALPSYLQAHSPANEFSDLYVLLGLLEDSGKIIAKASPSSTTSILKEFYERCESLGSSMSEKASKYLKQHGIDSWPGVVSKKSKQEMDEFRNAVVLMRDLCRDLEWQEIKQKQADMQSDFTTLTTALQGALSNLRAQDNSSVRRALNDSVSGADDIDSFCPERMATPKVASNSKRDSVIASHSPESRELDQDLSMLDAVIAKTHQEPSGSSWFPVRGKYDTGSDANFITKTLITAQGLESQLEILSETDIGSRGFTSLNQQTCLPSHKIKLSWCARDAFKYSLTEFYVVDDAPYDIVIGNPYIQEAKVFQRSEKRVALPIFSSYKPKAKREEDGKRKQQREAQAVAEEERRRAEAAEQRALNKTKKAASGPASSSRDPQSSSASSFVSARTSASRPT